MFCDLLGDWRCRARDLTGRIGRDDEEKDEGDEGHADQDQQRLHQAAEDIGGHQYRPFCVGSRISRSASPTRLKPSASRMMAAPGMKTSQGAVVK